MKKSLIAGASVMALAGAVMPMAGVFAADDTEIVDTITVTINPTCSFDNGQSSSSADTAYSATVLNGAEAAFNNSGSHKFNVTCNNNDGYSVSATPTNLIGEDVSTNNIPYTTSYSATGTAGMWTATVTSSDVAAAGLTSPIPGPDAQSHVIVTEDGPTDSSSFTVTYAAYVGTETPADTYEGTMTYGLAAL